MDSLVLSSYLSWKSDVYIYFFPILLAVLCDNDKTMIHCLALFYFECLNMHFTHRAGEGADSKVLQHQVFRDTQ